ncbi:hypothetical protein LR48_Vigan08g047200 [Vigna angularis]|uniref:Transposase (putative) gypsy type domain-containing protein n=1 Tax=Phaseolus angularis TaxID=3914 RepID=A0A0L9V3K0_PHAAN|nr:hypothetical protein LR48_Vigan08g047200 [Vigna angularis]
MRNRLSVTAKPYATISCAVCRSSCVSTWMGDLSEARGRELVGEVMRTVLTLRFLGFSRFCREARGRELVALGLKRILRHWAIKRFAFFNTIQKGVCHLCGRTEFDSVHRERDCFLAIIVAYAATRLCQNTGGDTPGPSSTAECPEVTSIPYGDEAFVYGNVCGEGPGGRIISPISGDEYAWAAREVKELRSQFRSRVVITNWIENSCVLRTLGYQTCIKLIACRDDERVCYGRENASDEFFYCYAALFYDLYLRLPFTTFQMDVLRTLNVAPSQLHPNSLGYVQAFGVLCQALGIRPTVGLFLYFFRCRPVATKGWVSLISEPGNALLELYLQSYRNFKEKFFKVSITDVGRWYFFDGEGNPRFPLYWTQDLLRFTSWPEDNMTIEELEALSVLTALPRPFSSRQLIDCLEFDDADARVFEIMGRKGSSKSWFQSIGNERAKVNRPGPSAGHVVGQPRPQVPSTGPVPVILSASTDETTTAEVPLVDLNMDASEKKVFENMSEQEIADTMLEMTTRAHALAWHLAYASDRGMVRVELEKVQTQLKELTEVHTACDAKQKRAEQLLKEAETLLNDTREAGLTLRKERDQIASELEQAKRAMVVLARERNELKAEASERNELVEELKDAIMIEHTRGFRKALRQVGHLLQVSTEGVEFDVQKDVHEGQLKPLNEIPEDVVLEGEEDEEVVVNTEHNGAVGGRHT